jgi:hypothetical protein
LLSSTPCRNFPKEEAKAGAGTDHHSTVYFSTCSTRSRMEDSELALVRRLLFLLISRGYIRFQMWIFQLSQQARRVRRVQAKSWEASHIYYSSLLSASYTNVFQSVFTTQCGLISKSSQPTSLPSHHHTAMGKESNQINQTPFFISPSSISITCL